MTECWKHKLNPDSIIDLGNPEITLSRNHVVYVVQLSSSIRKKYNEIYGSKLVTPEDNQTDSLNMKS